MKASNPSNFKNSLAPWIGRTMKLIDHRIEDILAENNIDLSRMQFVILKNIAQNQGICQNELAFHSNRNKSSLTRMIETLIKKEYIHKKVSKDDKRKNTIHLAEKGLQILAEATPHFQQLAQLVEQNLSAEDIERAKDILKIIQVNVTQEEAKSFFN
ncbi:MarR family transcriptional regulator [Bacteroidia bacterium]|nr:MarR family transcriptional regulator [Bacteroidia bacterium]